MSFESIRNHYEQLVIERIEATLVRTGRVSDSDFLEDVACVALNQLPARYVRHRVDLVFYLTPAEQADMHRAVEAAVDHALELVTRHQGSDARPRTITVGQD